MDTGINMANQMKASRRHTLHHVGSNVAVAVSILLLCQHIPYSNGKKTKTYNNANRLSTDMFLNYNKDIRPVLDQTDSVLVYVRLGLMAIQEVDEVLQRLTTTGWIALSWIDEGLVWNASHYGGITNMRLHGEKIWMPTLVLTNTVFSLINVVSDVFQPNIKKDGRIIHVPGFVLQSSCTVDITYYPFDVQNCSLLFTAWGVGVSEIQFYTDKQYVDLTYYVPGNVWTLKSSYVSIEEINAIFYLVLERKPQFVVLNVIIPIISLSILNSFVFLIPPESGERISYSLTVLLSLAVFLTLVGETLPKTSNTMSLFSYSLVATLVLSVLITLFVICNLHLYHQDNKKIGRFWSRLYSFAVWKPCKKSCKPKTISQQDFDTDIIKSPWSTTTTSCSNSFTIISEDKPELVPKTELRQHDDVNTIKTTIALLMEVIKTEHKIDNQTRDKLCEQTALILETLKRRQRETVDPKSSFDPEEKEVDLTWTKVSKMMDGICFVFCLLCVVGNYVIYFVKVMYKL